MSEITEESSKDESFGESLHKARLTLGLSLAEMAQSLNLKIQILEALENSDINKLPPEIYTQGYIKAYSKALGISGKDVHEKYMQLVADQTGVKLQPRSALPSETNSESPIIKMVSVFFSLLVVAAIIFGVYSYYSEKVVEIQLTKVTSVTNGVLAIPDPVVRPEANQVSEVEPVVQEKVVKRIPVVVKKKIVEKPKEEVIEEVAEEVTSSESDSVGELSESDIDVIDNSAEGEDSLMMRATAESWAEIRDRNKQRIYFDMLREDDFVVLQGNAPFDIFLGNALNVNVAVNDIDVDMSNFIRANNVAHFTVSEQSDQIVFH